MNYIVLIKLKKELADPQESLVGFLVKETATSLTITYMDMPKEKYIKEDYHTICRCDMESFRMLPMGVFEANTFPVV